MESELKCAITGKTITVKRQKKDGEARLPPGWKLLGDRICSPEGIEQAFACRSITIPVAIVEVEAKRGAWTPDSGWPEFRKALQTSWRQVTQVSNWLLTRLACLDNEPFVGGKLPKFAAPTKELQHAARAQFPELDSQSLYQVLQRVGQHYGKNRFELRTHSISLPTLRYPTPLPIPAKDLTISWEGERIVLLVRMTGHRFRLHMKNDPRDWGKAIGIYRKCAAGEVTYGCMAIREQGDHIMCSLPVWIEKQQTPREATESMLVRTDAKALLVGELRGRGTRQDGSERVFALNEDQLRRWAAAHRVYLQRMGEDRKAERRGQRPYHEKQQLTPPQRKAEKRSRRQHKRNVQRSLDTRCDKYHNRIADALHKVASVVVNHAVRRGVCCLVYDDAERNYIPSLPYSRLADLIREKAELKGITVVTAEQARS